MAAVRNLRTYLRGMKDQIGALGNLQLLSGALEQEDTEIFVPLAHKKTVFTLAIALNNLTTTMLRTQMSYYSTSTKQRKNAGKQEKVQHICGCVLVCVRERERERE